jgi:hypothetical protein
MRKLILMGLMLVSTLSFAHEKTEEEKRVVYTLIKQQLNEGVITNKIAQKMWKTYLHCCKK